MIERVVLCLFFMITCIVPAHADEKALETFLGRIQEASDKVHSFSCDFTQEKRLALFSAPVLFQGKLYIDHPDKLRWEFISPVHSALLFNGDQGARCDAQMVLERFELSSDPMMKIVAMQLWLWLGGDYQQLDKLYTLDKQDISTLVVTPANKETSEYISSVRIIFDENNLQPLKVEIVEPGGDLTMIAFNNATINRELPIRLFTDCRNE